DGFWANPSSGAFAYDTGGQIVLCNGYSINSSVSGPYGISTFYFRTKFVAPSNTPASGTLIMNQFNDDGAVFYLNGTEILRNNMPAGNVTYSTPPSGQRNPSCVSTE